MGDSNAARLAVLAIYGQGNGKRAADSTQGEGKGQVAWLFFRCHHSRSFLNISMLSRPTVFCLVCTLRSLELIECSACKAKVALMSSITTSVLRKGRKLGNLRACYPEEHGDFWWARSTRARGWSCSKHTAQRAG